ncbi:hypothetical protein RIU76_06785 [Latilactobacillus sakei subsp. sakei]|uniref:hypothetical protein n=1 Tax=Latilactobacillus sakei TaxID=1599 RepID=UPI00285BF606|nr:hypothetical protein [Latilactobacillus sakei]MDR7924430.1 hypothetical protein [Latilactobacillus sakei subsp. sakei]
MRIGAIQVGNILKSIASFEERIYTLKKIPETVLQEKQTPFVQIHGLPVGENYYSSNKKFGEIASAQIAVYVQTNREAEQFLTQIETLLSAHEFECSFFEVNPNYEYGLVVLTMRFNKYQRLK